MLIRQSLVNVVQRKYVEPCMNGMETVGQWDSGSLR